MIFIQYFLFNVYLIIRIFKCVSRTNLKTDISLGGSQIEYLIMSPFTQRRKNVIQYILPYA